MSKLEIYNEDCLEFIKSEKLNGKKCCIVTYPPFNIGYHYNNYKDKLDEKEYYDFLKEILTLNGFSAL